ncbi:PAS domain S-box [Candidatus Methanoperedens nitroreducens]|uniref:PAS domain S-box n=2 Tax=Candidatus Methanoperedens nitratireducens TaxID=1392998 RepID=A0A062V8L0_9EURY|nr:PAS domain S-box [Candidatus Methanoperedens nitroreducens]
MVSGMKNEDKTKEQLINLIAELEKTNEALRAEIIKHSRAEKELERFFNLSLDMFCIAGLDGYIKELNTVWESTLGFTGDELKSKPFVEFVHPEDRKATDAELQKLRAGVVTVFFENRYLCRDGSYKWLAWTAKPVVDESLVYAVARDVTERKRTEENVTKLLEKLRAVFDNIPLGIAYLDSDFKFIKVNKFVYDLTGLNEEDLIGKTCYETVGEYIDDPTKEGLEKICSFCKKDECFKTRRPTVIERPLGNSIIRVTAVPEQDQNGNISHFMEIIEDITEHKRAEEQIHEQASLLNKAHDAIGVRDLEHRITYWNKGAQRMYGWTAEEVTGKKADELLYKEESLILIEAKKRVIEEGEWIGELEQVTKNGKKIIVESRWTMVHDSDGRPKSILIVNTDITEKKKIEAQFFRAQRMESIGTLASGIAHDLNNVLVPVMLTSQILREKFTDEQDQRLLNIIETNTQRGADLIKQVMSFARGVEGEHMTLQVAHLIYEIKKIAKETFPRSIETRTDIVKDLWTISGDATQLHQVMMNLCVNARDAMQDGGVLSISAENLFIDENYARMNIDARVGNYIAITVSDTGTGIPSEILDRIFEPFFTTKEPGKGTGLGLSTVHAIVKGHGGFVNVYSEVGKGTTFKIYLPAIITTGELKVQVQRYEPSTGQGELVLVVDDEARICESTRRVLETHGYKAITANDGAEAVALYVQYREVVEVVLVDMMMPVMDGQACIRALRKINPGIRIIAVSGLVGNGKLIRIAGTPVHAFLSKPYTTEKLLKTIHDVLSAK